MSAVERVVRHAVFAYVDPDGVTRMAVRGDTIRVDGAELERGERFEAFFGDEEEPSGLDPLDGALVGDGEDLDDDDSDAESSPAGAQGDQLDGEDTPLGDELESTGTVGAAAAAVERPPLAANKDAWVDFRFAESGGRLTKEQLDELTKPKLQDDAHVAGLQPQG